MTGNHTDADDSTTSVPAFLILFPQMAIAVIGWFRVMLSINRLTWTPNAVEKAGFGLILISSGVRVVGALATRTSNVVLQFAAASMASLMWWTAFIIIINDSLTIPSVQQRKSLALVLVTSMLWEAHSRIMVSMDV